MAGVSYSWKEAERGLRQAVQLRVAALTDFVSDCECDEEGAYT